MALRQLICLCFYKTCAKQQFIEDQNFKLNFLNHMRQ